MVLGAFVVRADNDDDVPPTVDADLGEHTIGSKTDSEVVDRYSFEYISLCNVYQRRGCLHLRRVQRS